MQLLSRLSGKKGCRSYKVGKKSIRVFTKKRQTELCNEIICIIWYNQVYTDQKASHLLGLGKKFLLEHAKYIKYIVKTVKRKSRTLRRKNRIKSAPYWKQCGQRSRRILGNYKRGESKVVPRIMTVFAGVIEIFFCIGGFLL